MNYLVTIKKVKTSPRKEHKVMGDNHEYNNASVCFRIFLSIK